MNSAEVYKPVFKEIYTNLTAGKKTLRNLFLQIISTIFILNFLSQSKIQ